MRTGRIKHICTAALAACLASCLLTAVSAPTWAADGDSASLHAQSKGGFAATYAGATPLDKLIGHDVDEALDTAAGGDFQTGLSQADASFLLACAYGQARDIDAFREAAFARRLLRQLSRAPMDERGDLLTYLRAHPVLAHTLVFAVRGKENLTGAFGLLNQLRQERPAELERFPELASALCLVRGHPHRGFAEPGVVAAPPIDVFDFYVNHEGQMFYGLRGVPVELLIYIVDNPASLADMNWAVNKYGGTRDVGSLFFTISYDYDFFEGKAGRKLDSAPGGYSLPSILKVGGVCADQAYFATSVGKSIGVPSVWTSGESAAVGHAWVGFLKSSGRGAAWDFNSGRYEDYQDVRGNVTDPQTGEVAADSTVGLLSDLIGSGALSRQNAVASTDAARAWADTNGKSDAPDYPRELLPPPEKSTMKPPAPRSAAADGQLDLVEIGLRQFASYPPGWAVVADLAREGKLSEAQKAKWADLTQRMCGQRHMDFALALLGPMIETVDSPDEQSRLWDVMFHYVQTRADLAASVRMRQARMWEKQKNFPRAGQCYEDVLKHYINAGPFALPALKGAEAVLNQMGQPQRVLDLYAEAAKLVTKPDMLSGRAEFIHESNWYKVREGYADKLEEAGQKQLAEQIRGQDNG